MVALSVCLCCETYFNFSEYTAANIFKFNLVCLFITAFSIVWALFLSAGTYERNKYSVTPHFLIEILVLCSLYLRTWDSFFFNWHIWYFCRLWIFPSLHILIYRKFSGSSLTEKYWETSLSNLRTEAIPVSFDILVYCPMRLNIGVNLRFSTIYDIEGSKGGNTSKVYFKDWRKICGRM